MQCVYPPGVSTDQGFSNSLHSDALHDNGAISCFTLNVEHYKLMFTEICELPQIQSFYIKIQTRIPLVK